MSEGCKGADERHHSHWCISMRSLVTACQRLQSFQNSKLQSHRYEVALTSSKAASSFVMYSTWWCKEVRSSSAAFFSYSAEW